MPPRLTDPVADPPADEEGTPFGHPLKAKYFLQDPSLTNLNAASFGSVPRPVAEAQYNLFLEQESHLDHWFRQTYFAKVNAARQALAQFTNCAPADLVLVENASAAVNSVLRSGLLGSEDTVLVLSTAYKMVTNTLDWITAEYGVRKLVVDVPFPLTETTSLIRLVEKALVDCEREGHRVKLCVFSHISSMPALIEPVAEFVSIGHAHGALVLVDGAHAPGQIPIDIAQLGCDFYCGTCHKWLFAPKGTAFLWVAAAARSALFPQPTAISSSGQPDFVGRYAYTGTRDYTAFSSLPAALAFYDMLGAARVRAYNHELAMAGAQLCATTWRTSLLVAPELCAAMANVVLPSDDPAAVEAMQLALDRDHNVYIVCDSVPGPAGRRIFFTRLSAQVYVELEDFRRVAFLVAQFLLPDDPQPGGRGIHMP
eukprot:GGOE01020931.1.p1 GENE.GGOE01020931.1~~GGOE01020931.1.p1  ORF type:complete len:426 (+),score=95.97 GGOE01020931.1:48-1325(+)